MEKKKRRTMLRCAMWGAHVDGMDLIEELPAGAVVVPLAPPPSVRARQLRKPPPAIPATACANQNNDACVQTRRYEHGWNFDMFNGYVCVCSLQHMRGHERLSTKTCKLFQVNANPAANGNNRISDSGMISDSDSGMISDSASGILR
jgi:hypothetical protein